MMRHVKGFLILGSNVGLHDGNVGMYCAQLLRLYEDGGMLLYYSVLLAIIIMISNDTLIMSARYSSSASSSLARTVKSVGFDVASWTRYS